MAFGCAGGAPPFPFRGAKGAESYMASAGVIEGLDELEDGQASLMPGVPAAAIVELAFQSGQEAARGAVVEPSGGRNIGDIGVPQLVGSRGSQQALL